MIVNATSRHSQEDIKQSFASDSEATQKGKTRTETLSYLGSGAATPGTSFDFEWRPQSDIIDDATLAIVTLGTNFSSRRTEKGAFPNAWIIFKHLCKCNNF